MGGDASYDVCLGSFRSDGASAAEFDVGCAPGLSTFYDRSELRPGLRWMPGLEDAIAHSQALAILFRRTRHRQHPAI